MSIPSPGGLPYPRIEPVSLTSPAVAGGFFITGATLEAPDLSIYHPLIFLTEPIHIQKARSQNVCKCEWQHKPAFQEFQSKGVGVGMQKGKRAKRGERKKEEMRKGQMEQERECEKDHLKSTSGLVLNPQTSSLLHSICRKMQKSRSADPGPSQGHCIIKRKGTFLLGEKLAAEFPSPGYPVLSQRPQP